MCDHDVFAILTPYDDKNKASSAFKLAHNAMWFQPAVGGVAQKATIDSREPTPARDAQLEEKEGSGADRLVLTFSKLLRLEGLRDGVQAGTSTTSHILLGHRGTRGVSGRHYRIAIDAEMRIWLHDHSTHGTVVGYAGQNMDQARVRESWLLADAPGTENIFHPITIDSGGLIVSIEFPNHSGQNTQYLENLRALVEKSKKNEISGVEGLGLDSQPTTEPSSEAQTVSDRLIYFKHLEIGSGAFGRVFKIIRARDGKVLAGKIITPPPSNNRKRRRDEVDPEWLVQIRREYTIMKDNRHSNIVQVFGMRERPEIMIVMEYFPEGNITQAGICDESEFVTAFGQLLDAVAFLHENHVVHRDIKPDNVLVERVPRFKVVLSDFGLSKVVTDAKWLQTFCGTLKYLAPEVFPFSKAKYGPPADIWSLGVMGLEWLYGTLKPPNTPAPRAAQEDVSSDQWRAWVETWLDRLMNSLDDQEDGPDVELLRGMFAISPGKRLTARKGLMKGLKDNLFTRRAVDGLVACAVGGKEEEKTADVAGGVELPTATPRADVRGDPNTTALLSPLGGGVPESSGGLA